MSSPIRVLVWNEGIEEKQKPEVLKHYPNGIHQAIADAIKLVPNIQVRTATMDQPETGLSDAVLSETDVLVWWSHNAYDQVPTEATERVKLRVLDGMGFIALHSAMLSNVFKQLLGRPCTAPWRNVGERELIWTVDPSHPVAEGIEPPIELLCEEMYGEPFDVPPPDELVFLSWFEGGEVFRSGMCYRKEKGRIFYFRPGHETYPTFLHAKVQRVIQNAVLWAAHSPD